MDLSLGLLITMGSVTVGGVIIEKLLGKLGEIDKANMIGFVTTAMLASTVVASVIMVFGQIRKLGVF